MVRADSGEHLDAEAHRKRLRRGRLQALAILAICAAPVILGTVTFYFWRSAGQTNYGELLPPKQVELVGLDSANRLRKLSELKGKWRLVVFDAGACDEDCRRKLLYTRQIRLAMGRDQDRVDRIWFVDDGAAPNTEYANLYADAQVLRLSSPNETRAFSSSGEVRGHIFLVDPHGNLMMRYPNDPNPARIIKDLQRLLKYTQTR